MVHQLHVQDQPSQQVLEAWELLLVHLSRLLCQHQGLLLLQPGAHEQCQSERAKVLLHESLQGLTMQS